jgi:4-carboxymuconolactone decarboxylase
MTDSKDIYDAGMKVRRKILGDAHVDAVNKSITPLNKDFQDFITRYGWGEIWTRLGFDHRTRRILVLGTMMGLGRWEEFEMHLKAALRNQMSVQDVQEIFMQQAIYCGLPIANTAFHYLERVIKDLAEEGIEIVGL